MNDHYDYIIVGAGISGLYAAYRLSQKKPNCSIGIIEKLPRIGGRILTKKFDGHIMEYGPMRFEPELQKTFSSLLDELHITTKSFSPYTCSQVTPDYNLLKFDEINAIYKYSNMSPAFALLKYALVKILDEQWDVENDTIDSHDRDKKKKWLKKNGMFQGRYLHNHGLWDTFAHVLSKEAIDYIHHKGTFYHMLGQNPNAADQICFMLDILATATQNLITIDEGVYSLVEKISDKIRNNVIFFLETEMKEINDSEKYIIVQNSSNGFHGLSYTHLILTCQKHAYKRMKGLPSEIVPYLDSVMTIKLFKIFVILENPPFNETCVPKPNQNADKIPCREVHYGYDRNTKTGMVMIYGDAPSLRYWSPFISQDAYDPECSSNLHLLNHLGHYLRQIFKNYTTPCIKHYGILDWGDSNAHKSGVHLWKPRYQSEQVIDKLKAFGKNEAIHICGETYSDYQGFIEGCLRTVDGVISTIL